MEASSAVCCQLPRRHPVSTGQTASSLPCRRALSLQTNGPCHSAASFSLLVCGLSCLDNPFHLVLSLRCHEGPQAVTSQPLPQPRRDAGRPASQLPCAASSGLTIIRICQDSSGTFLHKGTCPLGLCEQGMTSWMLTQPPSFHQQLPSQSPIFSPPLPTMPS